MCVLEREREGVRERERASEGDKERESLQVFEAQFVLDRRQVANLTPERARVRGREGASERGRAREGERDRARERVKERERERGGGRRRRSGGESNHHSHQHALTSGETIKTPKQIQPGISTEKSQTNALVDEREVLPDRLSRRHG